MVLLKSASKSRQQEALFDPFVDELQKKFLTHNSCAFSGSNHSSAKMADRRRRRRCASQDSEDDDESGSGSESGRSGSPATKNRGKESERPEETATEEVAKSDVESECVSS